MTDTIKAIREAYGDDFTPNAADLELVADLAQLHKGRYSLVEALDECTRIDSKTNRIITQGHVIADGARYYADEADALAEVQADGYKDLDDAYGEEGGDTNDCYAYWTDWNDYSPL